MREYRKDRVKASDDILKTITSLREYRKDRVKASDDILKTITSLIEREEDAGSKKKHPAKWYQGEVGKILKLPKNDNPSLRSYEDYVRKIRKGLEKINNGPEEKPWSIASLKIRISLSLILISQFLSANFTTSRQCNQDWRYGCF